MNTTGLLSGLLLHGLTEHYNRRGRRSAERAKQEELRRLAEQKEAEVQKIIDWGNANFPNNPEIAREIAAKAMGAASPMKVMTDASKIQLGEGRLDLDRQRLDRQRDVDASKIQLGEGRLNLARQRLGLDKQRLKQAAEARDARAAGRGGSDTLQRLAKLRQAISEGQKEVIGEAGNTIGTVYPPEYLEVLKELERRLFKQLQEEGGLFADTPESLKNRNLLRRFDEFLSGIFGRFNERIDKTIRVDESVARQMKKEAQRKEAEKKKKEAEKKKKDASRVRPVGATEHYLPSGPSYGRPGLNR